MKADFLKDVIEKEYLLDTFDKYVIFSATDLKGKIVYVSEAFSRISGYTKEELLDKNHNIVRHEDMSDEIFKEMWTTIKLGKTWYGEIKNRRKDGDYYWVDAIVEPYCNDEQEIIGYHALRHDITDKKKLEFFKKELEKVNIFLEDEVQNRIKDIVALNKEIEETQKEIIFTMGTIGESRSKETGNHVKRVAEYSRLLAEYRGLDRYQTQLLQEASTT